MATPNERERRDLLRDIEATQQKIAEQNKAAATASGQELIDLEARAEQQKIILGLLEEQLDELNSLKKVVSANAKQFDDIDDSLVSIGNALKGNTTLQEKFSDKLNYAKTTLTSIANIVDGAGFDDRQLKRIDKANDAYRNMNTSIATAASSLTRGKISQEEYNNLIQESFEHFDSLVDMIDASTDAGQELVNTFAAARQELEEFEKAAQKSAVALGAMDVALDQMGSSSIPLAGELTDIIRSIGGEAGMAKAALIALGAAAGKLAYDYFGAPIQASIQASNDIKSNQIEGAKSVASAQNELAFVAKQSALDFGFQLQEMATQFRAASKTAFFGKGLGSVGYAASQLQLAGISAETIASATTAASKAGSGSAKLAADMAIFAQRSGISVDNVASIQQAFKLLDGVSADTTLNMTEGVRAMAEQAGLNVGDVMTEVASASEMALDYQIQSGKELARQVIYAKSLGVSFSDVAKAGQNMVLNYKDSIQAEMSLSAMLGRSVDLSEVRAKFMMGENDAAMSALKAQGLNLKEMNVFQKQAFQQTMGGMDLNSIEKILNPGYQENVGKVGTLEEKSAKASNDAFLVLKQSAESALQTQQAMIQGQKAVTQAALNTMKENQWLNSQAYLDYLAATKKLEIERSFTENIGGVLAATGGGLIGKLLPDIAKGIGNLLPQRGIGNLLPQMGVPPGGGMGMLGKASKFLTKGGGSALAGIFGGISGFMDKKEEGGTTGEAVGAGVLQGGFAVGGAALGTLIGGPIGTIIGGFLGDTLGGWVNDNAPGLAARFGVLWDSVSSKFMAIGEKFKPLIDNISQAFSWLGEKFTAVYDKVNGFLVSIGFEEGLGSIFSGLAEIIANVLMAPFEWLMGAFGFLADYLGALGQFLNGDFAGAWKTLSTGFMDFIDTIITPFKSIFRILYNGFAKLWNLVTDSMFGRTLGLGKMVEWTEPMESNTKTPVKTSVSTTKSPTKVTDNSKKIKKGKTIESNFSGNLQNEMVALLATNSVLLEQIMNNTGNGKPITLNGKKVNSGLLVTQRRNYAVAR
jgi:hypothetical protein